MSDVTQKEPAHGAQKRDPKRSKAKILRAAIAEFSEKGIGGARVDAIAQRADINKRMLYHYYGGKEDLYLAALHYCYKDINAEGLKWDFDSLDPEEAMRQMVRFTWTYFVEHPEVIRILNSENLHKAVHLKRSSDIQRLHYPLEEAIARTLKRGGEAGVLRKDVDPVQVYFSMSALVFHYLSHCHIHGVIFGKDFLEKAELEKRLAHIEDMMIRYVQAGG